MGMKDTVTKDYMEDCEVFADAFNYLIYDGRPVLDPKRLHQLDTTVIGVPYGAGESALPVEKMRDGLQCLSAMTDHRAAYLLLGVENQSEVHYAMPVRNMVYDGLQYAMQVEQAAKSHRKAKDHKEHNAGEYLSGFYKEDRLLPVITLVVYFGADGWDAPLCLHDMLAVEEQEIRSYVENYCIHLIAPAALTDLELSKFNSSLREVLSFIKYSRNKDKLNELVREDRNFSALDRKAVRVITTHTKLKLQLDESEEAWDMCQAIEEMKEDARQEGIETERKKAVQSLMKKLHLTAEQAMDVLEIPKAERKKYDSLLQVEKEE